MPEFPGSKEELIGFVAKRFRYPLEARLNDVEGVIEIGFILDEEGNVISPEILKGIGSGCDEEALRIIRALPKWNPASKAARRWPCTMSFRLT